jgi:hypothetical protein
MCYHASLHDVLAKLNLAPSALESESKSLGSKIAPSEVLASTWLDLLMSMASETPAPPVPLTDETSKMRDEARVALAVYYREQREKKYPKVRAARLRAFLVELANCVDAPRLARKYPEFLWPDLPLAVTAWLETIRQEKSLHDLLTKPITHVAQQPEPGAYLPQLRDELRRVWASHDERERNWLMYRLSVLNQGMLKVLDPEIVWLRLKDPITGAQAPPFVPFEQAIFYLQRSREKARVCRNEKCTIQPFFFSDRNSFCSEVCSEDSRKAAKRRAWHKNKKRWRSAA